MSSCSFVARKNCEIQHYQGFQRLFFLISFCIGKPYSVGCQTGGCGPGSLLKHNEFMKSGGTDFKGSYYLRSQPKLEVPKSK